MKQTLKNIRLLFSIFLVLMLFGLKSYAMNFISEVKISVSSSKSTAKSNLTNAGFTLIDQDLNESGGGRYVYLGYKTTTNPANAITGLLVLKGDDFLSTDYMYGSGIRIVDNLNVDRTYFRCAAFGNYNTDCNLNSYRAGKDDITLYYSKTGNGSFDAEPITSLGTLREMVI